MLDINFDKNIFNANISKICGIDEAGRGPLAGPVVAACVMIDNNFVYSDALCIIDDSKKMTEKKRELAYDLIYKNFAHVGVGVCSSEEIDEINILQASLIAMRRAYKNCGIEADLLLVDGNKKIPGLHENQETIIGGDGKSLLIAAASVIAKVTRDKAMQEYDRIFPEYGFAKHKGYGTKMHIEAIKKNGICQIHRLSFAPCTELVKQV